MFTTHISRSFANLVVEAIQLYGWQIYEVMNLSTCNLYLTKETENRWLEILAHETRRRELEIMLHIKTMDSISSIYSGFETYPL
jgi:hypothetical protein